MKPAKSKQQIQGFGLGLRPEHYESILDYRERIDWLEILTENYLVPGGRPHYHLKRLREHFPMVMHGVSLSIAGTDKLDRDYLKSIRKLSRDINATWISDHLCWTGVDGKNMHDLLPIPYTEAALKHVVERIMQVQDFLGQRILIENVSSYISYQSSEMQEWDFINEMLRLADCYLLLDINNIFVSGFNHNYNPKKYIDAMPVNRVKQFHLAGHTHYGNYIIDTHDHPITDKVWNLYSYALHRFGDVATMIERDDHIPPLAELIVELDYARKISGQVCHKEKAS